MILNQNISYLSSKNNSIVNIVKKINEKQIVYRGYVGFPHYKYDGEAMNIDAILVTKLGVLAIIDKSTNTINADKVYNKLEITLKNVTSLTKGRNLIVDIDVYTLSDITKEENFEFASEEELIKYYMRKEDLNLEEKILRQAVNAIEGCLTKEGKSRNNSFITKTIADLENNISNYDNSQLECLKDYEQRIQVISGLAGSGKTIIICK